MTRTITLDERMRLREATAGPRVGDFIILPGEDEARRICEVFHKVTRWKEPPLYDGVCPAGRGWARFMLNWHGKMQFSGALDWDAALSKSRLIDMGEIRQGECWWYDESKGFPDPDYNSEETTVPCRVFRVTPDAGEHRTT
jgi:hypothetical protein